MARRGKYQARRGSGGLPGWIWLLIGATLALVLVLAVPKYLKSDRNEDGFFRPRPNREARPAISALDEANPPRPRPETPERPIPAPLTEQPDYDFYTVLPGETALSDTELAAQASAEANAEAGAQAPSEPESEPAATPAPAATPPEIAHEREPARARTDNAVATPNQRQPRSTPPTASHPDAATPATAPPPAAGKQVARAETSSRYLLQAGAFSNATDAESLKARIALLGLQAQVEKGNADGKPVHRVRLGPYASASELAQIKQRLDNGGVTAQAVRIE